MGHSLLAATPGVHPVAPASEHPAPAAWAGDAPGTPPMTHDTAFAWGWPGAVVATLTFDPKNAGEKAYSAFSVVRGGATDRDEVIVDRIACLQCGASRVHPASATTFSDAATYLEAFEGWSEDFVTVHDGEACSGPYGDATADAAGALESVITGALGSPEAAAAFMGAFARSSLDVNEGEWSILVATPHGVRLVDAGIAGLASSMTLDGSPLTRDYDIDIRTVVARLGGAVAVDGRHAAPAVVAVSSDAYDLGVGVRRWTILTSTRVFVCETGPDPEEPATLGIAVGLDAYAVGEEITSYIPPDRMRVAMMLADGFDMGREGR